MKKQRPGIPSLSQMSDLVEDPFVIIDRDYRIVSANQRYCDHYSVTREAVVGRHCYAVSHHSDVPCHQNGEHCPLVEVFLKRQATNVIHVHSGPAGSRERVQLRATPLFDDGGEVEFMAETIVPLVVDTAAPDGMAGRSGVMRQLLGMLHRVAPTATTVLLEGESGSGKECAAEYLHRYSTRHTGPFVVVDCGALAEGSLERELFGVEQGANAAVTRARKGLIEAADRGTLYLDEICELPTATQGRLLRFLETSCFRRHGGSEWRQVDVRVVASTTRSLPAMVEDGAFRSDLYYRISAFPVAIPPLRDHIDDVPLLAEVLLKRIEGGSRYLPLSVEVIQSLLDYDYPGNVRELRNILERAAVLAGNEAIRRAHLRFERVCPAPNAVTPAKESGRARARIEERIVAALERSGGNRAGAARALGISERTVYRYLRRLRERYGGDIPRSITGGYDAGG